MAKGKWIIYGLISLLLIGFLLSLGAYLYYQRAQQPTSVKEGVTDVAVLIPKGSGQAEIANRLEQAGIIRDAFAFRIYMKLNPDSKRSQAGEYRFQLGMSWDAILNKLVNGETYVETLSITIPEGFTIKQIEERLINKGILKANQFEQLQQRIQSEIKSMPLPSNNPNIKQRLEGYLFPATYTFKKNATPEEVIQTFHRELAQQLQQLSVDLVGQLQKLNVNLHELLTVASLVEREVVVDQERALVAGVIYHRLKQNMPLQIDATIQYVLPKHKERLLFKDLKFDDPYNTYLNQGLPPGPISNPGLASIRAALFPEQTDYLFYVTKEDGTSGHHFATTYAEHLRNIERR